MLSLTGKRWVVPEQKDALNASHVLARIVAQRKIDLDASPTLINPDVFPDMQRACHRIKEAMEKNEKIGLFGDYDCDGVTAIAQLERYFARHDTEVFVRLPHRVRDGYGLSHDVVQELIEEKIELLITADTGIASVAEIEALQKNGIDVIVTDHHSLHEEVPPAYAIIHPVLSTYPEPHPAGAGVAFYLVHALEGETWNGMDEDLALAMCGTVADLVPLRGSNRALVQLGLQAFEQIHTGPLAELRERCKSKDGTLDAVDIAFRVAPRINAAGRIDEPDIALRALVDGGANLERLDTLNEERQAISRKFYTEVEEALPKDIPVLLHTISADIPHGVLGLIAGKLTEKYGRPSIVANTDGVSCTASLRSPSCYNIAEGLQRCKDMLHSYGGHAQAAGCSFALKDADAFIDALRTDVSAHTKEEHLAPTLDIDAIMNAADITLDFCMKLQKLEPFGQGNREPLLLLRNVSLKDATPCGDGTHVQARIGGVKAIGFGLARYIDATETYDIVARVGIDTWNGKMRPQIYMVDVSLSRVASLQQL